MKLSLVRKEKAHEPVRSFRELCEEFNVSYSALARLMQYHEGPKPALKTGSRGNVANTKQAYYNHKEFKVWFDSVSIYLKGPKNEH